MWLAAKSQRGEGAPTPPIQVRTKQYGKFSVVDDISSNPVTLAFDGVQVGDAIVQYDEVHCHVTIIIIIIKIEFTKCTEQTAHARVLFTRYNTEL
jgi:hypothetical protein